MHVSIRELKNHLSQYLQKVKMGESVIITSHHTPLARLLPIPQISDKSMHSLAQMEGIHWNGKKPQGGTKRPLITGKTISEYVLEDRR